MNFKYTQWTQYKNYNK